MDVRDLFLESEGDEYYLRNKEALLNEVGFDVLFYNQFLKTKSFSTDTKIVEIGACNGRNLNFFKKTLKCHVSGIEPSSCAVNEGNDDFFNGESILLKGTSDSLPWDDESVDIVMFGFSLFLGGSKISI